MSLENDTIDRIKEVFSRVNWSYIEIDQLEDDLVSVLPHEILDATGGAIEGYGQYEDKFAYCSVVEKISSLMLDIKSSEIPEQREALAKSFIYQLRKEAER